jgi:DNA-binding transcriptional regulator YiaG
MHPAMTLPALSGTEVRLWRQSLKMTQTEFWARVFVTQPTGSRHESDVEIPKYLHYLLRLVYCYEQDALEILAALRRGHAS